MSLALIIAIAALVGVLLLAVATYVWMRYYEARHDRTYMTHDEAGFKRALSGKTVLWDYEESVVRGPSAPHIEFVALDPATGGRRNVKLMDPKTGAINLRPQYCAPLPFEAVTNDSHKVVVDARVQFSLNRDLLKHVYEIQEFSLAMETRIQSAFRAEIGKRNDEDLRRALAEVERNVIEHLRRAEEEGDEAGEPGMALGVRFHTANFSYTQTDEFAAPLMGGGAMPVLPPGASPEQHQQADRARRRAARAGRAEFASAAARSALGRVQGPRSCRHGRDPRDARYADPAEHRRGAGRIRPTHRGDAAGARPDWALGPAPSDGAGGRGLRAAAGRKRQPPSRRSPFLSPLRRLSRLRQPPWRCHERRAEAPSALGTE